jgi:hypothetical protein
MESFNKLVATISPEKMAKLDPFYKLLAEIGPDAMTEYCYNFLMELGEVPYDPLRVRPARVIPAEIQELCSNCGDDLNQWDSMGCSEDECLRQAREEQEQCIAEITANTVVQPIESPQLRVWRHRQMTERHWPFMRAKNVANYLNLSKGRMNHMKILAVLAERLNITVDELLHMNPLTYMQRHDKKYIRYTNLDKLFGSDITYRLRSQLAYDGELEEYVKQKA